MFITIYLDFCNEFHYICPVIKTFGNKETERLWETGKAVKGFPANLAYRAIRKLQALDAVTDPAQLAVPPSNRLEPLKGDRAGFWSIPINDQWRLVFHFSGADAYDVEIVDYH